MCVGRYVGAVGVCVHVVKGGGVTGGGECRECMCEGDNAVKEAGTWEACGRRRDWG